MNKAEIKYDHRNLITEFTRQDLNQDPPITDITRYKYDEAGNRVRKTTYRSHDPDPVPLPEETEDLPTGWDILTDEYYSRDISGKEIAIYSSYTLQYWNVWSGGEITGRINNNENADRNYYLKDHLGSIRVVLDNSKNIVSANDYDLWGYYLQNRSYSTTNTKNKFTGKEKDTESNWDYFGARYYDARVGRWGGVEPLLEKYILYSPYQYGLLNPMRLVDANGKDVYITGTDAVNTVNAINKSSSGDFKVYINSEGKLKYEGEGKTKMERLIAFAINNENVKVHLITTQDNIYNGQKMATGMYYGSETIDGVENTYQIFNYKHAGKYYDAGGSSIGLSAMHEIAESFMGGMIYENPGVGYNYENYLKLHTFVTTEIEEEQYCPELGKYMYNMDIYVYKSKDGGIIPLYNWKTGETVDEIKK